MAASLIDSRSVITKNSLIAFSEEIKGLFLEGKIRTPIHLSGGNEDELIEIFKQVQPDDWVFSTYRSYYHALLKGIPVEQLRRDILAGKSMHINSREHRFFTSSIVGGCLPIATGVALGIQRQSLPDRVWVFVGDMAAETGIFHECVKYSHGHQLPISFVVEDNGLSVETPTEEVWRYSYQRKFPHSGIGKFVIF